MSDEEATAWMIRLIDMAADKEQTALGRQQLHAEFNRWASASPDNLRAILDMAKLWCALGQLEHQLIGNLNVLVSDDGMFDGFDGKLLPCIK